MRNCLNKAIILLFFVSLLLCNQAHPTKEQSNEILHQAMHLLSAVMLADSVDVKILISGAQLQQVHHAAALEPVMKLLCIVRSLEDHVQKMVANKQKIT